MDSLEIIAFCDLEFDYSWLRTIQNILMTCWLSGERSLPFGLLVNIPTVFYLGIFKR